jgi:hypothetical protein
MHSDNHHNGGRRDELLPIATEYLRSASGIVDAIKAMNQNALVATH